MFSMTKKRRFLRGFSVADFSAEKYIKNILQEMNRLSLREQQLPLIYVLQSSNGSRPPYKGGHGHPDPEISGLKIRGAGPCPRSTTA